ncbi:hypothetical protein OGE51_002863 [Vibrio cholerae]|uniref:hypothetical protein n=1 Tax=Gammaproteobacteria TaxID=1236 RepID=UPI00107269B3|nr:MULTISPECIES: hypothetical protein [Gammaproteobacteria]EKC3495606.1 hypothetical protein [Vibrio cholerae]EKF9088756.1 hypothetical protein [Vibrio cholerae]MDH1472415.1 hypothetical protein [Shewanella sp. GD03713]HAK8790033.1 hypothetical protein [Salmonella enterica]
MQHHPKNQLLNRPLEQPFLGTSIINLNTLIFNDIFSTYRLKTASEEQKAKPLMSWPTLPYQFMRQ